MNGGTEQKEQQTAQVPAPAQVPLAHPGSYFREDGGPGRKSPDNAAFPHINRHKLAQACNVTDSCIGKVFNRDTVPGLRLAGRIAKVLGVSMEELLVELKGKERL